MKLQSPFKLVFGFLLLICCLTELKADEKAVKTYICHQSAKMIKIDGLLTDTDWQKAETIRFVDVEKASEPQFKTEAKMCWNKNYLYVAFSCEDPDVWAVYTQKDSPLWKEEVVEIYIDPDGNGKNFVEIEVNPHNAVVDLFWPFIFSKTGFTSTRAATFDFAVKSAVHIKGTINNIFDQDKGWDVELAIPWENLSITGAKNLPPEDKDEWRINLYRYERPVETSQKYELTSWSPTYKKDFSVPERFGRVVFLVNGR